MPPQSAGWKKCSSSSSCNGVTGWRLRRRNSLKTRLRVILKSQVVNFAVGWYRPADFQTRMKTCWAMSSESTSSPSILATVPTTRAWWTSISELEGVHVPLGDALHPVDILVGGAQRQDDRWGDGIDISNHRIRGK